MAEAAWDNFLAGVLCGRAPLLGNAQCTVQTVALGDAAAPAVINSGRTADTTWIVSLRNTYGRYARAEARAAKFSAAARALGMMASHAGESCLAASGLSGGCYLDHWLVATDLHAPQLNVSVLRTAAEATARIAPDEPIILRSLTPPLHGELLRELARAGFELLPMRQVWLVADPASGTWRHHRDAARDLRLATASAHRWVHVNGCDFSAEDFLAAHGLYQQLYRGRYPHFNPDYSLDFIRQGVATGFLEITALRSVDGGPLQAFVGMIHRGSVSATPLLGYDLSAPAELGLYRLLSTHIWQTAERRGTVLHCSAGAGAFKASRGAESHVEFAAVWTGHLTRRKRAALTALAAPLRKWAVPYLERNRL